MSKEEEEETHERKRKHTKYSNRNNRILSRQYSSNTVQFEHELFEKKNTHREHDKYINTICMLFFMCFIWLAVAALFFLLSFAFTIQQVSDLSKLYMYNTA